GERALIAVRRPGRKVVVLSLAFCQYRSLSAVDVEYPESLATFVLCAKDDAPTVGRPARKTVVPGALGQELEAAASGGDDGNVRDLPADTQRALKGTTRSKRDAIAARRPDRRDGVALEIVVNQPPVRSVRARHHDAVVQQRGEPRSEC